MSATDTPRAADLRQVADALTAYAPYVERYADTTAAGAMRRAALLLTQAADWLENGLQTPKEVELESTN